ncbi:MAG: dUTP diphosphatase [Cellulosilyticaceae bacterium]
MEKIGVQIMQVTGAKDLPIPKYMTQLAAGVDLYANVHESVILEPGAHKLIATGIAIALPEGYEAQVRARSGLAAKHGIGLVNGIGTIDADYRGEIKVILMNWGDEEFEIKRGERIAQMVINQIQQVEFQVTNSLDETSRGEGGFGHTGC